MGMHHDLQPPPARRHHPGLYVGASEADQGPRMLQDEAGSGRSHERAADHLGAASRVVDGTQQSPYRVTVGRLDERYPGLQLFYGLPQYPPLSSAARRAPRAGPVLLIPSSV